MNIKEQVIDDKVSGLRLEFKERKNGGTALFITSKRLTYGNRDFSFDPKGNCDGRGTSFVD